ncbi:TetR/AcrR family transcriptional regulator [Nocardia heshunensis]
MTPNSPASSPRQDRRKARTRGRILDAAEELFLGDGAQATIEQIAETADVAIATIYQHFGGKDDLHFAVVERAVERNEQYLLAVYESDGDPVEKLIDAGGAYTRFFLESPRLFQMIQWQFSTAATGSGSAAAQLVTERITRMNTMLEGILSDGIKRKEMRRIPVKETARALWGSMNGILALAVRPDALRLTETELFAVLAQAVELYLEGLVTDECRGADGRLARRLRQRVKTAIETAAATALRQGA